MNLNPRAPRNLSRQRRHWIVLGLLCTISLVLVGCSTPALAKGTPMRGNPSFDEDALPESVDVWYRRILATIESPVRYPNEIQSASTGDLYQIGRIVNGHVSTLLLVFRYTGDLRLLDAIDPAMQAARSQLKDYDGDGYRNWRWLHDPQNKQWYGEDYHSMDEDMTHGLVAAVAWAYQNNRDLESPAGIDYGERADFWLDYLKNDFEAKWRDRDNIKGYTYLYTELMHPYLQTVRYFHYMGLLTGDEGYTEHARALAAALAKEFRQVDTPTGPAYVWGQGLRSEGSYVHFLQPAIYAAYSVQAMQELALEGMEPFADTTFMKQIARAVTQFLFDEGNTPFSVDIGGHQPILDLDAAPLAPGDPGYARFTEAQYAIKGYAALAHFDDTGAIAKMNQKIYDDIEDPDENVPQRIFLPAAFVVTGLAAIRN